MIPRVHRWIFGIAVGVLASVFFCASSSCEELSLDKKAADKPADAKLTDAKESFLPSFSAEREAAAMTFVKQNHPELAALLTAMSKKNPAQYQNAVRDLYKTSERLTNLRSKDSTRADLELEIWKNQSRINLLVARLRTADAPKLREELRSAIVAKFDATTRRLELDVVDSRARLEKQEKALANAKEKRDKSIENLYQASIRSAKPAKKVKAKGAVESKAPSKEKIPSNDKK